MVHRRGGWHPFRHLTAITRLIGKILEWIETKYHKRKKKKNWIWRWSELMQSEESNRTEYCWNYKIFFVRQSNCRIIIVLEFNLLRWTDVPCTLRIFCPKNCNIPSVSSIFKYNPGKTNNKFITSQSFLSSDITPTSSKGKRRIIVYGLVTRYGPQSVATASD